MNTRDLKAWELGVDLSVEAFEVVRTFPWQETRDLANQMRSAAVSVPSNIAEAVGRFPYRDQRQFVYRSRGSLLELETQIEIARRLKLLSASTASQLECDSARVGQLLNGLIRYFSERVRRDQSGAAARRERPR